MERAKTIFLQQAPAVDFCAIRIVEETQQALCVRQGIPQPIKNSKQIGAMVTVVHEGGYGYGATCQLTPSGIGHAIEQALNWAKISGKNSVVDYSALQHNSPNGEYQSTVATPWSSTSVSERLELLRNAAKRLKQGEKIVDWHASLWHTQYDQCYLTADGQACEQQQHFLVPNLVAVANEGVNTQIRSLKGGGLCHQGGLEILDEIQFENRAAAIGEEALMLLAASNCPADKRELLLMPDQMLLQIHESIGHPIELDRILGDERNYAGTTFVKPDMFGHYQYGSELLNVSHDPSNKQQFASYGFDDDGLASEKHFVIEKGILKRPLGGQISQQRAQLPGVANSRASSWNRPPIDRIANLNLESGNDSLNALIASVEHGILMATNRSWSIDDSRNKFQFGCEWGQLIENGKLTAVVKNPCYRGISATFWRSLCGVGNEETRVNALGSPYCGKGEPNQVIRVGHASPCALFTDVEVFAGE